MAGVPVRHGVPSVPGTGGTCAPFPETPDRSFRHAIRHAVFGRDGHPVVKHAGACGLDHADCHHADRKRRHRQSRWRSAGGAFGDHHAPGQDGQTVGAVQRVDLGANGAPAQVSVALIGGGDKLLVLDAGQVKYDPVRNAILAAEPAERIKAMARNG